MLRSIGSTMIRNCGMLMLALAVMLVAEPLMAQVARPAAATPGTVPRAKAPYRTVVPGVEVTIKPDRQEEETHSTHDVVEVLKSIPGLNWQPQTLPATSTLKYLATEAVFRRKIWNLEFTFKPVRMLYVDIPGTEGKMQRKLIWYMVYHVKNMGNHLAPVVQGDGSVKVQATNDSVRFFPQFVLEAPEYNKVYLDRVIPLAVDAIVQKEDPQRKLLNSVEISGKAIPVSTDKVDNSVWGVATWEDIDPRVDFFTIYVQGLTNAYRWVDPPAGFKPGDAPGTGRVITQKTLMLNFWRPGDDLLEHERVIRYGIPGKVDYAWVYR